MTQFNEALERSILNLLAADKWYIATSSLDGRLKRMRPKLAGAIYLPDGKTLYKGERVYARIQEDDITQKARTMTEAIDVFCERHPRYGEELRGLIAEERQARETNLYFGLNEGCRMAGSDYLAVGANMGFGEVTSGKLCDVLIETGRNIRRKRGNEERSIMLGTTLG